jgi:glucose/arabinose dehydrogenase
LYTVRRFISRVPFSPRHASTLLACATAAAAACVPTEPPTTSAPHGGAVAVDAPLPSAPADAAASGGLDGSPSAAGPPALREEVVFAGLVRPTALQFSADGRVFVAEQPGRVKAFDSPNASTPRVVLDISDEAYDNGDRGLLGLALDPHFPQQPYLYALYTLDGMLGDDADTVPRYQDGCPDPTGSGCLVAGRLSRFTVSASAQATRASEVVLVENWGQQYLSHSIGGVVFGPDGMLYVSGGEGAHSGKVDYGQFGANPLDDPPQPPGGRQTPPTAMGGALRSQVVTPPASTPAFPAWYSGKVIRVDPHGPPTLLDPRKPNVPSAVVALGLRNPFRIGFRPGTTELWIADVGWNAWEELDRIPDVDDLAPRNFGWPCYEGELAQPDYAAAGLDLCASLYRTPEAHTLPVYTYNHAEEVVAGDGCPTGHSAVTGVAFNDGDAYPDEVKGSLFFADAVRNCIWVMPPGRDGVPDPALRHTFHANAAQPVDLQIGPGHELYYVDHAGTVRRLVSGPSEVAASNR